VEKSDSIFRVYAGVGLCFPTLAAIKLRQGWGTHGSGVRAYPPYFRGETRRFWLSEARALLRGSSPLAKCLVFVVEDTDADCHVGSDAVVFDFFAVGPSYLRR